MSLPKFWQKQPAPYFSLYCKFTKTALFQNRDALLDSEKPKVYPPVFDLPKGQKFDEFIKGHKGATILVFYANWCGPCKEVKPFIHKRAHSLEENSNEKFPRVIRINMDHHHDLADKFAVFSIPCLVLMKDGRPIEYASTTERSKISELFLKAEVIGFA